MNLKPFASLAALLAMTTFLHAAEKPQLLKVSENHRYLVKEDGTPFFYMGDTAWELFHRLTLDEAKMYLKDRADKGFNVIQSVVLAEFGGLTVPNANGDLPLIDGDPGKPNEKYFRHVDAIVNLAEGMGLYIGMLPTWGDKWNKKSGDGPEIFNVENAFAWGELIGKRYKDKPIIWILGGDRNADKPVHVEIIRSMAAGLRKGDGGKHLVTMHPSGGKGSAEIFGNDDATLDFNMRQNGHGIEYTGRYDHTLIDYKREPAKPIIDAEPIYEGHPVSFNAKEKGHSIAADIRKALYWDLFSGACGHTYGHHSIWQMYSDKQKPVNNPLMSWTEAMQAPGAMQVQYGRRLIESRPMLTRIPDDDLIIADGIQTSVPGAGTRRFVATRDLEGSYAMIYAPVGRAFSVRLDKLKAAKIVGWWFNPRNGQATRIGEFIDVRKQEFTPPDMGEDIDWVLVLDDAAKKYGPPGEK